MYKDNLFSLIRKEEVIIWAGAGLSINAGFPSGQKLGEILVNNLSKSQREIINSSLTLPDLAEEFYRLKGNNRNALITILKKTFQNTSLKPTSLHEQLSIIPHFKTIITTNYDTLIEDSFKEKGQVVLSSNHIPYLEKDKAHIFKVHGDLNDPSSVIITKSDYNNFFKSNSESDIFWTVIKERISTKSVLFLGYNLEDPNVSVIFERITDALGKDRKECFLVAPNLPQHKVDNLTLKGIQYINITAEELISELLENLKENIIDDLEKGNTSADTFREFLLNMDVLPELKTDENKFKVKSLHGVNDKIEGKMNLTFKNDTEFIKELNDYAYGKKIGNFEVPEDKLINIDFWFGDLKFPNIPDGIQKLEFKSVPKIETIIDLRFEDNSEYIDIPVKLYGSISFIEIHLDLKSANFIINIDITTLPNAKVKFNYKHHEICKNVKEEIELFTLLKNLGEGKIFTVYPKNGSAFSKSFSDMKPLLEEAEYFLEYFNNLKTIEQHYKVRFSDISIHAITDSTFNTVDLIVSVINNVNREYTWNDELIMDLTDFSDSTINQLKSINELNHPVVANNRIEEIIELHGHDINIGYKKIEFLDTYVVNLESIIDKTETEAKLKSKSKKMIISYESIMPSP